MSKKTIYNIIKWLIVVAAFGYLGYKLFTFDKYDEFIEQWRQTPPARFWWLIAVFLLLPVNWLLESAKWQLIILRIQKIKFIEAFKGVFAGITAGFFTPNRLGDMFGRIIFLEKDNRASGITLSLLNSLTQNLIIILCGVPACIVFFLQRNGSFTNDIGLFIGISAVLLVLLGLFYFFLPTLSLRVQKIKIGSKINKFTACLSLYSTKDLLKIMAVTFFRYLIFSTQFFCMMHFFGIDLSAWQAVISIPTNYLFVTLTPSIAFSEMAVRASYSIFIFSAFSDQTINIALAGAAIWVVNWVIPLIVGSVITLRSKA